MKFRFRCNFVSTMRKWCEDYGAVQDVRDSSWFDSSSPVPESNSPLLPMEGMLSFNDASLVFAGENCQTANGTVATDMFQRGFAGPQLGGRLVCAGGQGVARLAGKSENVEIAMTVGIRADRHYRLDTTVNTAQSPLQAVLAGAGFVQRGNAWERSDEGILAF